MAVEVRSCLVCGLKFRGAAEWCSPCQAKWPFAFDGYVNPVELPPNSPNKQRAIDIVLAQVFGPVPSGS